MSELIGKVYHCTAAGARPPKAYAVFLDGRPPFWCLRHGHVGLGGWQLRIPIVDPSLAPPKFRAQRLHLSPEAVWSAELSVAVRTTEEPTIPGLQFTRTTTAPKGVFVLIDPDPPLDVSVQFVASGPAARLAYGKFVYGLIDRACVYRAPVWFIPIGASVSWFYDRASDDTPLRGVMVHCEDRGHVVTVPLFTEDYEEYERSGQLTFEALIETTDQMETCSE